MDRRKLTNEVLNGLPRAMPEMAMPAAYYGAAAGYPQKGREKKDAEGRAEATPSAAPQGRCACT